MSQPRKKGAGSHMNKRDKFKETRVGFYFFQ